MRYSRYLIPMLLILLILGQSLLAQSDDNQTMLFAVDGDIVTMNMSNQDMVTVVDGDIFDPIYIMPDRPSYTSPILSPDGKHVFFQNMFDEAYYVAPVDGGEMAQFTDLVRPINIDLTFSPVDSTVLLPAYPPDYATGMIDLWRVTPEGEILDQLGSITIEIGCSFGPMLPLIWLPDESVITGTSCTGIGVQRFDPATGETTLLDNEITRVALSPDATTLAGAIPTGLRLIDLESGDVTDFAFDSGMINRIVWLSDGRIAFSSVTERGQLALTPQDEQLAIDVLFDVPENVTLFSTSMHIFDAAENSMQQLWVVDGWRGIPIITATDDTLYFSAIPDMEAMVNALNDGVEFIDVVEARPESSIYAASIDGSDLPALLYAGGAFPTILPEDM